MRLKILAGTFLFFAAAWCCAAKAKVNFKFHQLFTDHAVLQQNIEKHPFRGSAAPGSKVEVHFRGKTATATADDKGNWSVFLPSGNAGTGFELKAVCNGKTIQAENIAVGEVWFVSGQSNAKFPLKNFKDGAEWAKDADYPQIRFQDQSWQPPHMRKDDRWQVLDQKSAMKFSATGFFFAKALHKKQNVPVGIIISAVNGTTIKSWIPEKALAEIPHALEKLITPFQNSRKTYPERLANYEKESAKRKNLSEEEIKKLPPLKKPNPPFQSYSTLFYQLVARLAQHPVKGAIWYQGEADAMFAGGYIYREYLAALIKSYRAHFGIDDLPFLVVEIPYYGNHHIWSDLRDSQKAVADNTKNVFLVSIPDLGDLKDIHPPRKAELGERLLANAERFVYGKNVPAMGPVYDSMEVDGSSIILKFKADSIGGGLCANDGKPLRGFRIAGKDGKFVDAAAEIKGDTVIVSSPKIKVPAAVRYGWYPPADGVNFFNKAGFPSGLFRTDNFRLPTQRH